MQFYVFDSSAQMKELLGPLKILDNMMYYYDLYESELKETKKDFFLRNAAKIKKNLYLKQLLEKDIFLQINRISRILYILPLNCRYYIAVRWIYFCLRSNRANSILGAAKLYQKELAVWSKEKKNFTKKLLCSCTVSNWPSINFQFLPALYPVSDLYFSQSRFHACVASCTYSTHSSMGHIPSPLRFTI